MKFRDILKTKIKPELNNIYTEKPFMTQTGTDFGWFCNIMVMGSQCTWYGEYPKGTIVPLFW